jgi:hypothetical protein
MTVISTANPTADTTALIAELGGQASQSVDFMIGVGLVKDSDAVFFQYQGDEQKTALMEPSGKPCTRIGQVFLSGLTIIDNVYEDAGFKGSKLNVFLRTQNGTSLMLTSGLATIWSQCLMTCLMGLCANESLDHLITIDTWKGTSKMRPCFAAVRDGAVKVTHDDTYEALAQARSDKDKLKTDAIMRDAVELISAQLAGGDAPLELPQVIDVTEQTNDTTEF